MNFLLRQTASVARRVPSAFAVQVRNLNIHEFQGKKLMNKYGVTAQPWRIAETREQALEAAASLGAPELVVKAQILAGGRGKGTFNNGFQGGVHLCKTPEEAADLAEKMLGNRLVTKQTGKEGALVRKVMICSSVNIAREVYFSILMDRGSNGPVMLASPKGGMDIEAVAEETPEYIFKDPIDIVEGITEEQTIKMAKNLEFQGDLVNKAAAEMRALYEMFLACDATQVEINPLAETTEGQVLCLDAKVNFDDNASFRQKEIYAEADTSEDDPREVQAAKFDLNYIGLDGSIGCMVNGAGLAMATMDIIKLHGGSPANFLDVGGGADEKQVTEAFKILTDDPNVKAILVNIFGGIMKCDTIAQGVVAAARIVNLQVPLVVRLAGTNVEAGLKILKDSGLPIIGAADLDDAAKKAVASLA